MTTTSGAVGGAALAERVHQYLMTEIVEGRLRPGVALREAPIGEQLGVSRTPVREALRELAVLGLVRIEVNRSYRVAELDLAYLAQASELYAEVFGMAARLAGPRLTARDVESLAGTARDAYQRGLAQGRVSAAEAEFIGDLFLRRCGNVAVEQTLARLRPHAWRLHHAASREVQGMHLAERLAGMVAAARAEDWDLLGDSARGYFRALSRELLAACDDRQPRVARPARSGAVT